MFVLFAERALSAEFRRLLEVDLEAVAADGGIERVVDEVDFEAELVAIVGRSPIEIVDEKLRRDRGDLTNGRAPSSP